MNNINLKKELDMSVFEVFDNREIISIKIKED